MKTPAFILALCLTLVTFAPAQEAGPAPQDKPEATAEEKVEVQPQEQPKPEVNTVILIISQENINKILVVKTDGTWVPDARNVTIKAAVGGDAKPTVDCVMYKGLFRPTSPETKTWTVETVMVAPQEDFQKILDGLQKGEFNMGD